MADNSILTINGKQTDASGNLTLQPGDIGAMSPAAGYIDGLILQWVSGTALTVTAGSAYVQGLNRIVRVAAPLAKTGLTLVAATWYHVYLLETAGSGDIEITNSAPDVPYNGQARSKAGDTSRRYIGSVRTSDSSAVLIRFTHEGDQVIYLEPVTRLVNSGTAATMTTVSCASAMPLTSRVLLAQLTNNGTTGASRFRPKDAGWTGATGRMYGLPPGGYVVAPLPVNANLEIEYQSDVGGSANLDPVGFRMGR